MRVVEPVNILDALSNPVKALESEHQQLIELKSFSEGH